jgi:hypothetical protein
MRQVMDSDFKDINEWRAERKAPILPLSWYPNFGMIVEDVAAGFLTITDSDVAILEHFVTNPLAYRDDRMRAIHEIATRLEDEARKRDYKHLIALTSSERIVAHALALKFKEIGPLTMLGKEL